MDTCSLWQYAWYARYMGWPDQIWLKMHRAIHWPGSLTAGMVTNGETREEDPVIDLSWGEGSKATYQCV